MGCDIHCYLEVRHFRYNDKDRNNGVWANADKWVRNSFSVLYPEDNEPKYHVDEPITRHRNYFLFAALAGVRNYWDVKPVRDAKGMPDDAADEVKAECERYGVDGHSHSWLTFRELANYEWPKECKHEAQRIIDKMSVHLKGNTTADDVRIVFWFDN